jgi:hypothetical protein
VGLEMTAKQAVIDHVNAEEQQRIRCAVSWKYGITDENEIDRRVKRLRKTDIQDLLWEFEDYNVTHEWDD